MLTTKQAPKYQSNTRDLCVTLQRALRFSANHNIMDAKTRLVYHESPYNKWEDQAGKAKYQVSMVLISGLYPSW